MSDGKDIAERKRRLRTARSVSERLGLLLELAQATFLTDRAQSRRCSAQALALARKAGDLTTAAGAANLLADIARLDGRSSQALRYAHQALDSARRAADPRAETDSLNSLGLIWWHRGECRRAIELFTQCLERSTRTGDERLQSRVYNNLSLANWEAGNLNAAMEYQERSLELRRKLGERYDIGISQMNVGLIHGDMGTGTKPWNATFGRWWSLRRKAAGPTSRSATTTSVRFTCAGTSWTRPASCSRRRCARPEKPGRPGGDFR